MLLMLLIGAFIIINLNILLHRWLNDERKVDEKGNPTMKEVFKKKIKKAKQYERFLKDLLLPGN
jgi:hypothetical protein